MKVSEVSETQADNLVHMLDAYAEKGGHHLNINVFTPIRLFAVPVVGKRLTYAGERSSEAFEEFFWHGMNYAVLPSMSSTGSLIFDSGLSPLIRAMMDCAASSPMRSIS